jgi:hypothetical protein
VQELEDVIFKLICNFLSGISRENFMEIFAFGCIFSKFFDFFVNLEGLVFDNKDDYFFCSKIFSGNKQLYIIKGGRAILF